MTTASNALKRIELEANEHRRLLKVAEEESRAKIERVLEEACAEAGERRKKLMLAEEAAIMRRKEVVIAEQEVVECRRELSKGAKTAIVKRQYVLSKDRLLRIPEIVEGAELKHTLLLQAAVDAEERESRRIAKEAKELRFKSQKFANHVCTICIIEPRTIIIVPCGHKVYCAACYARPQVRHQDRCPICRMRVKSVLKRVFD